MTEPSPVTRPAVSVVCPFFNEEAAIGTAVQRLVAALNRDFTEWELILVDDGSTDRSREMLAKVLRAIPDAAHVRIIGYGVNQGRGHALKSGIDAARHPFIATTEVDLSWGEGVVARMIDEFVRHPSTCFVVASPHLPGGGYKMVPLHRVWLSQMGNHLINLFVNFGLSMHTGMTRAYRREVIQPLQVKERGKEFHLEVALKLAIIGFSRREVPAVLSWEHRLASEAAAKVKSGSSTKLLKTIASHLSFLAIAQPMRYFGTASGILMFLGLLFMTNSFIRLASGQTAIFIALTGLFLLLFAFLFAGLSVVFVHLRDGFLENWRNYYPNGRPPISEPATEIDWHTLPCAD